MILNHKLKYLQIALNSNMGDAFEILHRLPTQERILIEAGTPLIKQYGLNAVRDIYDIWQRRIGDYLPDSKKRVYIVADIKTADLAEREVKMFAQAGASAATCLGVAPLETINFFIKECKVNNIDSMIDMMNVFDPILVLDKLDDLPDVVILHRGVDEQEFNPEKQIPFNQIQRIKDAYDIMIAIAGGDTIQEVQRAAFNDADIIVVWKSFYQNNSDVDKIAEEFLKEIR